MGRVCAWLSIGISLFGLVMVGAIAWDVDPAGRFSVPHAASRDAVSVDNQLRLLVGVGGPIFVFACLALGLAGSRTRRGATSTQVDPERDASADEPLVQGHPGLATQRGPGDVGRAVDGSLPTTPPRSRTSWLLPMLLGVVILAVSEFSGWMLAIPASVPASDAQQRLDDTPATLWALIRIREFECRVSYPGPDRTLNTLDDIHVAGELRIPVNETVRVQLEADDGPHRWFVPSLRRNVALRQSCPVQLSLSADVTGEFAMLRVDLSGDRQDATPGKLVVQPASDVRQWLDFRNEDQQRKQTPDPEVQP